jgi:hypothetical protein
MYLCSERSILTTKHVLLKTETEHTSASSTRQFAATKADLWVAEEHNRQMKATVHQRVSCLDGERFAGRGGLTLHHRLKSPSNAKFLSLALWS